MHDQHWYYKYLWSSKALPAGTYRLRVPVPDSNGKTVQEQGEMLAKGETPAPVVLVAAALLCIRLEAEADPLNDHWTRCLENTVGGRRVVLSWNDGRLGVGSGWDENRNDVLWSSSVRTS